MEVFRTLIDQVEWHTGDARIQLVKVEKVFKDNTSTFYAVEEVSELKYQLLSIHPSLQDARERHSIFNKKPVVVVQTKPRSAYAKYTGTSRKHG